MPEPTRMPQRVRSSLLNASDPISMPAWMSAFLEETRE
jgi:hypothetical protein